MKRTQKQIYSELAEAVALRNSPKTDEKQFDFETFKIEKLEDFDVYNAEVRKFNRNCVYERNKMKIKVPDGSFHKKIKVKFQRFDQPQNVLKTIVRNKDIEWRGQLKPGKTYELPLPVVNFLNKLAVPIFAEVKVTDGGDTITETQQVGESPRFSCQVLDIY